MFMKSRTVSTLMHLLALPATHHVLGHPQDYPPPGQQQEAGEPLPLRSLPLPPEYTFRTEDRKSCDNLFGEGYLRYIAEHQDALCAGDKSSSRIQRFFPQPLATDFQHPDQRFANHYREPIHVVQGAVYSPSSKGHGPTFKAQCNDRGHPYDKPERLDPLWAKNWDFSFNLTQNNCSAHNNQQWFMIMSREGPFYNGSEPVRNDHTNVWHKVQELWQAKVTLDILRMAINPSTGKAWLSEENYRRLRIIADDDRDDPWDNYYEVINGKKLERLNDLTPGMCLGNVVLSLASLGSPFWAALLERAHHEPCAQSRLLADTFIRQLMEVMGVKPRPSANVNTHPSITIVQRTTSRKFWDADRLVKLLYKKYPNSHITVQDFADISLLEQVQLMQSTDVLVAHHGAALNNMLFLREGSAVVEFTPEPILKFRSISTLRGLVHITEPVLTKEDYTRAQVKGERLPKKLPKGDLGWQEREWAYLTDEQWLGAIDAGVRSQSHWRYDDFHMHE